MLKSEFRIVLVICLFLNGNGVVMGDDFPLKAAPVGKCFFYRFCLINHAFK